VVDYGIGGAELPLAIAKELVMFLTEETPNKTKFQYYDICQSHKNSFHFKFSQEFHLSQL
jgi:hypothetical protein